MTNDTDVSFASLTTLRVGGRAHRVLTAGNESEVREAIRLAEEEGLPWYPMGRGSNLLAPDQGYAGVIIRLALPRTSFDADEDGVVAVAEAGVVWDTLVSEASTRGLWGIENLAGIPGTVGAAPVQNIGAYGAELADTLLWVEALDPATGEVVRLTSMECAFGYRDSRFKRAPGLIILRVAFRLREDGAPKLSYKDLRNAADEGAPLATPREIADAVRAIRARKFPDLTKEGTAGSFFKNPTIGEDAYATLLARYPDMPGYPGKEGVKVSLAWILDKVLEVKGLSNGGARLYEAQPLVIATTDGATAADVNALADEVSRRVREATGITIEREVRTLI